MNDRTNPFKPIYDICNAGNSKWRLENQLGFPIYLDIEMTNSCNFSCLMCPTGNLSQKRPTGFMEDATFYQILSEIEEHKTPIRFIRWGEPTMHPKLVQYMRDAKNRGIICDINTNGSYLDEEKIQELIDAVAGAKEGC